MHFSIFEWRGDQPCLATDLLLVTRAAVHEQDTRRNVGYVITSITRHKRKVAVHLDQPNDTQLTDMDSSSVSITGEVESRR